ncbi:MAG: murein biosynthesis integral membrane protein MurJ [Desulfovibrionaceae bacterium]
MLRKFLTRTQHIGFATILISISILLSRFMGLFRDKIISWQFGATIESDIYFLSFILPDFINYLLAGGYFSIILIPFFSRYFDENEKEGYQFFISVFLWVSLIITSITFLCLIFASEITTMLAPTYSQQEQARLTLFLRIILPAQIFFLSGAVFSALLYMRRQFIIPALMPLIYNLSIILGGLLIPSEGMEGYCYGVLIGAFIGAFILPIYGIIQGGFSFHISFFHKGLIACFLVALPLMLGQSITVLEEQYIRFFSSFLDSGFVSILQYARRIMLLPVGVIAQAIGVASYPLLSALLAQNKEEEFASEFKKSLYSTIDIIIPLSLLMIILAKPIISLIFHGGAFTSHDVLKATPLLQILLLGVPFWAIQQLLSRAFYAYKNTLLPTIIGTIISIIIIPVYIYLGEHYSAQGIALASTIGIIIYSFFLLFAWKRKYAITAIDGLYKRMFLVQIECLPSIILTIIAISFLENLFPSESLFSITTAFFINTCGSLIFLISYLLTLFIYNKERLVQLQKSILRK